MVLIGATLKGAHHCLVHGSLCSLWVLEPIWGHGGVLWGQEIGSIE